MSEIAFIEIQVLVSSDLELKPVGKLEVKLVQAKELTNKDIIGKSDPYAVLYVRPLRDKMKKSRTIVRLLICLKYIVLHDSFITSEQRDVSVHLFTFSAEQPVESSLE